jgi:hypothetical protein
MRRDVTIIVGRVITIATAGEALRHPHNRSSCYAPLTRAVPSVTVPKRERQALPLLCGATPVTGLTSTEIMTVWDANPITVVEH